MTKKNPTVADDPELVLILTQRSRHSLIHFDPSPEAEREAERKAKIKAALKAEQTAAANNARRFDAVQKIIETHASALRKRHSEFNGNNRGTAITIRPSVRRDLQKLKKTPAGWKLADESDPDAVAKEIGRITKRLERWTNVVCPTK
jgi:hypothetical protein